MLDYVNIIKELRTKNEKSQKEVAAYLGVKQQQYSRYETGEFDIPIRYLIKLADFYKVTVDYIAGNNITDGILGEKYVDGLTGGEFLLAAMSLRPEQRKAAVEFVQFQKNK